MSRNAQSLGLAQDTQVLTPPRPVLVADPMLHSPPREWTGRGFFRALALRLFLAAGKGAAPRTVLFCSTERASRHALISARVAQALAEVTNLSLCLLDADLRSPRLHEVLGCSNQQGLGDFLRSGVDVSGLVQPTGTPKLGLVAAGANATNGEALIFSERLGICVGELRSRFDCVLMQGPPVCGDEEAVWMGRLTDGVVLVLEAGVSRREKALRAKWSFEEAGVKVLGAVLNGEQSPIPGVLERLL